MPLSFLQIPILRIVLSFILGIVLQYSCPVPTWYVYAGLLAAVSIGVYLCQHNKLNHKPFFGLFVLLVFFALGSYSLKQSLRAQSFSPSPSKQYVGRLEAFPVLKNKTLACAVCLDNAQLVLLYLQKDSLSLALEPGTRIYFKAPMQPIDSLVRASANASFSYPLYLQKQGYAATAYVPSGAWQSGSKQVGFKQQAGLLQHRLKNKLRGLSTSAPVYSFGATMLLGDKTVLSPELRQSFAASGISHILSVSGLHVQIIYVFLFSLFSWFAFGKAGKLLTWLLALLSLWVFAFVTGLNAPVVRAATMLSLYTLASLLGKQALSLQVLSVSAFLQLLYQPLYLFDVGFQLSYLAVFAILLMVPYIESWHVSYNPLVKYIWTCFSISIAAQVLTAPLCWYYFQQFPLYFWLGNVLIAPLIAPALVGMLLFLLLPSVWGIPLFLFKPIEWCLQAIIYLSEVVQSIPFSLLQGGAMDWKQLLLAYGCVIGLLLLVFFKKKQGLYTSLVFVLLWIMY